MSVNNEFKRIECYYRLTENYLSMLSIPVSGSLKILKQSIFANIFFADNNVQINNINTLYNINDQTNIEKIYK